MKKFVLAFLLGFCSFAFADPAPFGLELNKATFEEVTKKYPRYNDYGKFHNVVSILGGKIIEINKYETKLDNIYSDVTMYFDDKDILHSVTFQVDGFRDIYNSLERKYGKSVGVDTIKNQFVFRNGNSMIKLTGLGFGGSSGIFEVWYLTKEFNSAIEKKTKEQEQTKKQKQDSLL